MIGEKSSSMIQDNIEEVLAKIHKVCARCGRDPGEITLVAVTKFADMTQINEAVRCGITHLGENKVQEAKKKYDQIKTPNGKVTRHMIGHLQSNKAKHALEIFDCIQSVDSQKLAKTLSDQAALLKKTADVLVQVNTAGEAQKFGVAPQELAGLLRFMTGLKNIRIQGLMTIAPLTKDETLLRQCFGGLKRLRDDMTGQFGVTSQIELKYLSMGMTDDYEIAIEEGSNMVRIGRAIFQ